MTSPIELKYGWLPDLPDYRDHRYKLLESAPELPSGVDLRVGYPGVYDQGDLGSCVANAVAYMFEYVRFKQGDGGGGVPPFDPSRLFLYWEARRLMGPGWTGVDNGTFNRLAIKAAVESGIAPESDWPYDQSKVFTQPPQLAYDHAVQFKAMEYLRLDNSNLIELKQCLTDGYPFVFGFTVFGKFPGLLPGHMATLPVPGEQLLGGHSVVCMGYSDQLSGFLCKNSWGTSWGNNSDFVMPYEYLTETDLANDFWTIRNVT